VTSGTLTVTQAGTTTALSVSSASATPGTSVTLTAQVASATTGAPTGAVSFFDGASLLGTASLTSGTASFSTTSLAAGTAHPLSAIYSGDVNFTTSTSTSVVGVTVSPLDFTFLATGPTSQTVIPGRAVSYSYAIAPTYGTYAGPVGFTVFGLPPGATYTFSQPTITVNAGAQTVTLTIATTAPTAASRLERNSPWPLRGGTALAFGVLLPLGLLRRRRRFRLEVGRGLLLMLLALAGSVAVLGMAGCGSGNGFYIHTPKNYTVTVTATSGTIQHSSTVTLNLQ